MLMQEPTQL